MQQQFIYFWSPTDKREVKRITLLSQAKDITLRLNGVHLSEKEKRVF